MKVAHLVYVLIVAIFVVIVTLLYQNSHPVDISDTYVPKEFRYKIVVKHASVILILPIVLAELICLLEGKGS